MLGCQVHLQAILKPKACACEQATFFFRLSFMIMEIVLLSRK